MKVTKQQDFRSGEKDVVQRRAGPPHLPPFRVPLRGVQERGGGLPPAPAPHIMGQPHPTPSHRRPLLTPGGQDTAGGLGRTLLLLLLFVRLKLKRIIDSQIFLYYTISLYNNSTNDSEGWHYSAPVFEKFEAGAGPKKNFILLFYPLIRPGYNTVLLVLLL